MSTRWEDRREPGIAEALLVCVFHVDNALLASEEIGQLKLGAPCDDVVVAGEVKFEMLDRCQVEERLQPHQALLGTHFAFTVL